MAKAYAAAVNSDQQQCLEYSIDTTPMLIALCVLTAVLILVFSCMVYRQIKIREETGAGFKRNDYDDSDDQDEVNEEEEEPSHYVPPINADQL